MKKIYYVLIIISLFIISGCGEISDVNSTTSYELTGSVDGNEVSSNEYQIFSDWFVTSIEEEILVTSLNSVEKLQIKVLGLDPDNDDDIIRFKYFINAFEYRVLMNEYDGFKTKKDVGIYFYDLYGSTYEPNTAVNIVDLTVLNSNDGNKLDTIRAVIDDMRTNNLPDVIVAFSPDRSKETIERSIWINLFAENTYFASSGEVTINNVRNNNDEIIYAIDYNDIDIKTIDLNFDVKFGGEPVTLDVKDVGVDISS